MNMLESSFVPIDSISEDEEASNDNAKEDANVWEMDD